MFIRTINSNTLTKIQRSGYYEIFEYQRNMYKYSLRIFMMYGYCVCEIGEHKKREKPQGESGTIT